MIKLNKPKKTDIREDFIKYYKIPPHILDYPLIHSLNYADIYEFKGLQEYCQEKDLKSIPKQFVIKNNTIYLIHDENLFEVNLKHYKGNKKLKASSLEQNLKETNLLDIFLEKYELGIYNAILSKIHNRHYVLNRKELIKRLLQFQWFNKEHIRIILPQVINDIGIKEVDYKLKNGSIKKRVVPNKYLIHMSCSSSQIAKKPWKESFPEEFNQSELFIQGGGSGIVFSKSGNYSTAFVEVFPKLLYNNGKSFSTFIRGEGKNLEEAEESAFNQLLKMKKCTHEWDRRGRTNGHAFCSKCGVFNSDALEPLTKCVVCDKPTTENSINEDYYCSKHYYELNSNKVRKKKIDEYSLKDYKRFKLKPYNEMKRTGENFKKIKNKELTYGRIRFERIGIKFRFLFIHHFITKYLVKRNICEINDKIIDDLTYIYITKYSIISNELNKHKEFFSNIETIIDKIKNNQLSDL